MRNEKVTEANRYGNLLFYLDTDVNVSYIQSVCLFL